MYYFLGCASICQWRPRQRRMQCWSIHLLYGLAFFKRVLWFVETSTMTAFCLEHGVEARVFKSGSTRDASRSLTTRCCCIFVFIFTPFWRHSWVTALTGTSGTPDSLANACHRDGVRGLLPLLQVQRSKLNLKAVFFPTMPQTLRKDIITVYYYPSTRILNSHWNRFIWATGPRHQHRCHSETEHDISLRSLSRIVLRSYGRTLKYILI